MRALPQRQSRQRGAVAVIVVVLFLVIVGYAAITSSTLVSTGMNEASVGDSGTKAELLARSGLERAFYLLKNGTACGSLSSDAAVNYGAGKFDITDGTTVTNGCQVTVLAQVGQLTRTLTGVLNATFSEPFTNAALLASNWPAATLTSTRGDDLWHNANCGSGVCSGSSGGSYYMWAGTTGATDTYAGYRQTAMSAIATGASGATVTWRLGWKKRFLNTGAYKGDVVLQAVTLSLVDSVAGVVTQLWSHTDTSSLNTWTLASGTTALPANRNYDAVRVTFNLRATSKAVVEQWVDEIQITKQ